MDITIACSDLKKGLQQVISVIPTKTTVPILSHILIEARGGQMTLSATDLEVSLQTTVAATVEEEGSVTILGRLWYDVVKEIPDIPLKIDVDENNRITMKSTRGQYTFFGEDSNDFPQLPTMDIKQEVTIDRETLKRYIEKTIFSVSVDELRASLTGVLFQVQENEFRTVATDGHRLVRIIDTGFRTPQAAEDVIVPLKALNLLLKNLDSGRDVKISFASNYIAFDLEDASISASLIDAKYPDYDKVIPKENSNKLLIKRDEFISALRTVSVLANKITQQIKIKLEPSKITIASQDMDRGEGIETIDAEYSGEPIEIGFNSSYVLDILQHIDTEEVSFHFGESTGAALAFPSAQKEKEDILMLVMPIKLRD